MDTKTTPMMAQWHACKKQAADALVLFRLGDFFEAFHEDALIFSKELDLTLTKRQDIPMCGVPAHTVEGYIDKMIAKGYKVAIVDQVEDARLAKGLVRREIVRTVTPGTVITSSLLSEKSNNFLVCLTQLNAVYGLAILDLTTADFRALQLENKQEVFDELARLKPSEVLLSEKCAGLKESLSCAVTIKDEWMFDHRTALEKLLKQFEVQTLDGFGLKGMTAAVIAAGTLLVYLSDDLSINISHLKSVTTERLSNYMAIDQTTQRHLEVASLISHLDATLTPMGGRRLKQWLSHPLLSPNEIEKRQAAIQMFISWPGQLSKYFQEIRDLERLIMRIETGYASPRDLMGLRISLEQIPGLYQALQPALDGLIAEERDNLCDVSPIVEKLKNALVESPPIRLSDGGIFKKGYHPLLDELSAIKADNSTWIANYQVKLREETQIKTLKVGFTNAFGYYIEVSRGQAQKMPDNFERRQTLVNAERFITPELKDYEHKVLTAEERMKALESELFHQLRHEIAKEAHKIRTIAAAIASLDCLHALAQIALRYRYVRPLVDESNLLDIKAGRHPVIESARSETFIPNDVHLDDKERLILITGPNMAGKSTYIRQVALIVIMAQAGCFVPAESAHIGIIDKVFSRIGANDDLARGQSTFMVEMTETANILHHATPRSLVILDEIGRGTSTYDGISIAWAVAEYLLMQKPKTLFATHYWELTELEEKIPGAVNYHVAVQERREDIVFLHKIVKGSTDRSYGIHVAKLAGLPLPVIKRAQAMLASLEKGNPKPKQQNQQQLDLFALPPEHPMFKELKALDPNTLTPMEALQKIMQWKKDGV